MGTGSAYFLELSFKRFFDIILSSLALALLAPVMLVVAVVVKIDSPGPVFYRQVRVGENRRRKARLGRRRDRQYGRPFTVYKFRSMRIDAEADGRPQWCRPGDPRVTRVGAVLRQTHLDELPQLFNVLFGDMSLVGPRPERPEFVRRLAARVPGYERRLAMKPGLTGLAQVRRRADVDESDVRRKVRYDLLYARNATPLTDLKIVLATVPMVFGFTAEDLRKIRFGPDPAGLVGRTRTNEEPVAKDEPTGGAAVAPVDTKE